MKKILLATSGLVHPPFLAIRQLQKILCNSTQFHFTKISSLEKLPSDIETFSALVIYFHQKTLSGQAMQNLDDYVSNGGGLLGIHSATASFKKSDPYFNLLGGRFTGHGKVERITINYNQEGEIFPPTSSFTIHDELYYHELSNDLTIHYSTPVNGEKVPVVWTRIHGNGKVCYAMPGHTLSSFNNPAVQMILTNALEWVASK